MTELKHSNNIQTALSVKYKALAEEEALEEPSEEEALKKIVANTIKKGAKPGEPQKTK